MLTGLLFLIILVCVAFLWNEGLWGNAITLVNVVFAALVATNYFEPLAAFLEDQMASFTYFWDFLSIWMIFVFTFGFMRVVTDKLTKTKVKFKGPVEHAGRAILALAVGYVMMSFVCFTLHLAPLPEHAFGGAFHRAEKVESHTVDLPSGEVTTDVAIQHHLMGIGPDYHWHQFAQSLSEGPLNTWFGSNTFDPEDRYFFKYGARRRKLEEYNQEKGAMRVNFSGT